MQKGTSKASNEGGRRIVLAYSGGLDTSCILAWLVEKGYQVTAYLADIGQDEDFAAAKRNALELGATEVIVDDLRAEFVRDFAWLGVACGIRYEGRYLLGTSLARPAICRGLVRAALKRDVRLFSHGATSKGNDQVRFELGCSTLAPDMGAFIPWRDPEFTTRFKGRQDLLEYAKSKGFPVPATPAAPYSVDSNLLHVSYESGVLEEPNKEAPSGIFQMTADLELTPDMPHDLEIDFEHGTTPRNHIVLAGFPVNVRSLRDPNVKHAQPVDILSYLNKVGGEHGVGRIDIVENRFIGLKSRGVYESPGMTILYWSHLDLETFCLDREILKVLRFLKDSMSDYVYNGFWFSPECVFVRDCLLKGQRHVTGTVRLRLFKGNVMILGRRGSGSTSLYNKKLVSMDEEGGFRPSDATGFINCQAVRLREFHRYAGSLDKL